MSLSNPQAKNPAARFMQWRGGAEALKGSDGKVTYEGGKVTWYDKEAQEENEVELPFSFIVLDELNTITGFSESDHSGYWSNEVRNLQQDELIVRTKAGIKARGVYGKIADQIKAGGAKYAKSVYVAFKDESGELQIGNIKIAGAALTAWIEFQKKFDVSQCAVYITDEPKLAKKGSNYYFAPVFEGQNMNDETKSAAVVLDEDLQRYLNAYFQRKPDLTDNNAVDDSAEEEDEPEQPETAKAEEIEIEDLDSKADSEKPADEPKTAPKKEAKKLKPLKDVAF